MRPLNLSSCWIVRETKNLIFFHLPTQEHFAGKVEHSKKRWKFKLRSHCFMAVPRGRMLGRRNHVSFWDCPGLGTSSNISLYITTLSSPSNQKGQSRHIFCFTYLLILSHSPTSHSAYYLNKTAKKEIITPYNKWPRRSKQSKNFIGSWLQNQLVWNLKKDSHLQVGIEHLLISDRRWVPGKLVTSQLNLLTNS